MKIQCCCISNKANKIHILRWFIQKSEYNNVTIHTTTELYINDFTFTVVYTVKTQREGRKTHEIQWLVQSDWAMKTSSHSTEVAHKNQSMLLHFCWAILSPETLLQFRKGDQMERYGAEEEERLGWGHDHLGFRPDGGPCAPEHKASSLSQLWNLSDD